ncbi:MAG: DUF1624 domain-containing protein [Clostridiales bacterium]|nr:DUF1624 domain-containing protein [Clostridiales bacterium]
MTQKIDNNANILNSASAEAEGLTAEKSSKLLSGIKAVYTKIKSFFCDIKKERPDTEDGFLEKRGIVGLKKKRVWEIDFIRGFCILLMIMDHIFNIIAFEFASAWRYTDSYKAVLDARFYWHHPARKVIHEIVLFLLFSVSGISGSLSRSNLKRGIQLSLISIVFSLVTFMLQRYLGFSGVFVHYGVLNFLATCIMIYAVLQLIAKKNKYILSVICAAIFITSTVLFHCYTPPSDTPVFLFFLFPAGTFYTQWALSPGDLFPFITYAPYFFFGAMIGPLIYGRKKSLLPTLDRAWHKPVSFIGRYALLIYLTHILVLTLLIALISFLFITPGDFVIL